MFRTKLTLLICFISLFLHGQEIKPLGDANYKVTMSGQASVSELRNVSLFQQSEVELTPKNRSADEQGNQHSRYHILLEGTPVKGIHVTAHYNPRLQETTFIVPRGLPQKHNLALSTRAISYDEALVIVKEAIEAEEYSKLEASPTGITEGLVIVPQEYDFKKPTWVLAYEIDVQTEGPWQSKRVTVDAQTGEIIFTEERLCSFNPGTADTYHHGTRPVTTTENNGTYIMQDQTRGSGIITNNYNTYEVFTDSDDCWDNSNQAVAGDAHWGSAETYDFYLNELGLDGLDGNGLGITSYVHLQMANAYWDGTATFYGDGDSFGSYDLPFTHMSVIAHEITHGVTHHHSALIYSGESGAMNESISDIIGAAVEYYVLGSTDWRLGNDVSSTGSYFRNLADPNDVQMAHTYMGQYWDTYSQAVHTNSSIGNFWFYLLVEGGTGVNDNNYSYTVDSIGWESAWQIAHNTWTTYLTPSSDYPTCAELSIVSATNLFGACSNEVAQVRNAWAAVGVLSSGSEPAIEANPTRVCEIPTEVDFFSTGEVANHTWDFGDGSQSNDATPTHIYQDVGTYTVSLTGTDCNNDPVSIVETDFIIVDTLSTDCDTTYMDVNQTVTSCSGILVDDGGAGNYSNNVYTIVEIEAPDARAYEIDIRDFAVESGYDGLFLYVDSGNGFEFYQSYTGTVSPTTFTVEGERLQFIWDTDFSVTYAGFVIGWECVTPSVPVAAFSSQNTTSCNGYAGLQDESEGYPDSWTWFLDGVEVSTEQNPVVTLPVVGMYDVGLIACNNLGCDTVTIEDYITYNDQLPFCDTLVMADDLETVSYSCEGVLVDDGGIDGYYANNVYSVVALESPDAQAYEIDIQYFYGEGCCDYLRLYADYGNGDGYELIQSYVGSPTTGSFIVEAEKVQFIWDTDGSVTRPGFVISWQCLTPSVPTADFSSENTVSCDGYAVLQDESTGFPDSWTWFLDGVEVSTEENPLVNLPVPGMYDVGLIACNDLGCDTVTVEDYITYDDQLPFCDTLIMADDLETTSYSCEGILVDDGGIDGYYANNVYSVVALESPDAQAYEIDIQYFYGEGCCDYLSLYADYGNGYEFVQSFVGSPTTGAFIIEAEKVQFIWDTDGSVTRPGFIIAWQCLTPTVPTADFSTENTISCDGYAALQDESTGFPDSWTWFLDGVEVSTEQNPVVSLPVVGMYDVGLIACNDLGCDTVTVEDYITYDDQLSFCDTIIMADDLQTTSYSCEGVLLDDGGIDGYYENNVYSAVAIESPDAQAYEIDIQYFYGQSCCDYLSLYADYGNGYEFVQSFVGTPSTGAFVIEAEKVQFIWDTNSSSTYPGFVVAWQCLTPTVPTADFSSENTVSCNGYAALQDESAGFPDSWTWFLDGVEVSTEQNPVVTLPAVGMYDVGLIACNDLGCDTVTVEDYITYDDQLSFCDTIVMADDLETVSYSCEGVLVDDGGIDGYYANNVYSVVAIESPDAVGYEVDIQYFYGEGCCDYLQLYADYGNGYEFVQSFVGSPSTGAFLVEAEKIRFVWDTDGSVTRPGFVIAWECITPTVPTAAFSVENTISCDGYVALQDESTGYPDSWTWFLDGVQVSTDQSPVVNLPVPGTYDVGLVACNDLGCDTVTVEDYVTYDDELSFCDTIVMVDDMEMLSYACEGVMVDDGGLDGSYSNGIYSVVQVETPGAAAYLVDIQSFYGEGCCDYFRVYADYGSGGGYQLVQSFVGSVAPTVLTIEAPKVQFIWSTDGSVTYPGFVVAWQCIGDNDAPLSNPSYEMDICSYTTTLNSNAFNADQVVWNLGDGNTAVGLSVTHTYLEAGDYMVHLEASNSNGVSADSMLVETIFEVAMFEIPDPVIVDQPTTISLSSHAPGEISSIQWFLDGVLVSSSYSVSLLLSELGTYTLNCVVTDTNGCVSTHSETVLAVAVDVPEEFKNVTIFPNPTSGELQIRNLSGINGVAEIALLNTVGQLVTTVSPVSGADQVSLDLHALPTGIYVLKIQNDEGKSFFKKVVKTD